MFFLFPCLACSQILHFFATNASCVSAESSNWQAREDNSFPGFCLQEPCLNKNDVANEDGRGKCSGFNRWKLWDPRGEEDSWDEEMGWGCGGVSVLVKIPALLTGITPRRGLDNARLANSKCVSSGAMAQMPSAYLQNTTWTGHYQWLRLNFLPVRWLDAEGRIKLFRINFGLATMVPVMKVLTWEKNNCSPNMRTKCDFSVHLVQTLHF